MLYEKAYLIDNLAIRRNTQVLPKLILAKWQL